jgi:hypothetical protein
MTPVKCRVKHDPDEGTYGDCVRACIASLLEFDAEQVPHFFDHGSDGVIGQSRIEDWLSKVGYTPFFVHVDGASHTLDDVLQYMGTHNPNAHYMLYGRTSSGDHVVVAQGNKIVHDPAWFPIPLIKSSDNGFWSIMVIARK